MARQGAVLTYVQYNDYELDSTHFNDLKRQRMKVIRIQLYHKIRNLSSDFYEKIEKILQDLFPDEKDVINGVLYQPGDGLCVIYKDMDNIPLPDFLKGKRI